MKYAQPFAKGQLIKRYKRFLADVRLGNGDVITVHTPNTGSMMGCAEPGFSVWIYDSENDKRKYRWSWFLVEDASGAKIGINTALANDLVHEALENGVIIELQGYSSIKREKISATGESRFDLFLSGNEQQRDCFVEVKSVTAKGDDGVGIFPDAVTKRGLKHLLDLQAMVSHGFRAALVFCVQRDDVTMVRAASEIDPEYAQTLKNAAESGVQILAYRADLQPDEVKLVQSIPVIFP